MDKKQKLTVTVREVAPKFYAQKCPTCSGFGTLKYGAKTCNGCGGKTWILVPTGMDGNEKQQQ